MDFVPRKRDARYAWLTNLSGNVVGEAVKFGALPADATAAKTAADALLAKMDATNAAKAALDGARIAEEVALQAQMAIIRGKARNWKTLGGWAASGSEGVLQFRGSEPAFDPLSYKPDLAGGVEGGLVRLTFTKLGVDGVNVYTRLRGQTAWRKLSYDSESPYVDTAPLAQPGVAEVREYMARGVLDDVEIGLDSDIVSIPYGG